MKRRGMGMLCIAIVFALLFSCVSVPAGTEEANDGWLSITIGDDRNESASVDMTLSQIRQRIADRKIKPTADGVSDEKGKIEFKELAHGIYYIEMTAGPERLTMSAMLLSVPNSTGSVQVRAMAKYEYETPTPSPTPSPKPTFTPFVPPVEPETPSPTPSPTPTVPVDESPTPSVTPEVTPTAPETVREKPTAGPTGKPVITKKPVPTPPPTESPNTPVPRHVPTLRPNPGETTIAIEDYEVALGLYNIQIHVGVCFE